MKKQKSSVAKIHNSKWSFVKLRVGSFNLTALRVEFQVLSLARQEY